MIDLATSILALTLELLQTWQNHTGDLENDARRNVWHDTESEDRSVRERSTHEHVIQSEDRALVCGRSIFEQCHIDARDRNKRTHANSQQCDQCKHDPLAKLFDPEHVPERGNDISH